MLHVINTNYLSVYGLDVPIYVMTDAQNKGLPVSEYILSHGIWLMRRMREERNDN